VKFVALGLVTAWLSTLIPVVLGLCGARSARHAAQAGEPWVWDALDRDARGHDPALPSSHPLARLRRFPSQSAV